MSPTRDRDALVDEYRPLAVRLARRYRHTSEPLEDLVQVAYLGLILAADRYTPEHGNSFTTFAVPTILGELRRHLRNHGWTARVPRRLQENVLRVAKVTDELSGGLRRAPTPEEVARETGLDVQGVIEARQAAGARAAESLDHRAGHDEEREPLIETLGHVDQHYEFIDHAVSMRRAVAKLSPRQRTVLAMRFFEDLTQAEIGAFVGLSQMQVSRMLRDALQSLHEATQVAPQHGARRWDSPSGPRRQAQAASPRLPQPVGGVMQRASGE